MLYELEMSAELAAKAGYRSAFYELGIIALEEGIIDKGIEYLKRVPRQSHDFADANVKLGTVYYSLALRQENLSARNDYLREATEHARFGVVEEARQLLLRIGFSYIYNGDNQHLNIGAIPNEWLYAMNETCPPYWCWNRLNDLKHSFELEKKVKLLEEKLNERNETEEKLIAVTEKLHNLSLNYPSSGINTSSPVVTFKYQAKTNSLVKPGGTFANNAKFKLHHSTG